MSQWRYCEIEDKHQSSLSHFLKHLQWKCMATTSHNNLWMMVCQSLPTNPQHIRHLYPIFHLPGLCILIRSILLSYGSPQCPWSQTTCSTLHLWSFLVSDTAVKRMRGKKTMYQHKVAWLAAMPKPCQSLGWSKQNSQLWDLEEECQQYNNIAWKLVFDDGMPSTSDRSSINKMHVLIPILASAAGQCSASTHLSVPCYSFSLLANHTVQYRRQMTEKKW